MSASESSKGNCRPLPVAISDMSPVTNLAFGLSSLSTSSVAGTPMRRISWSNPIPGGSKMGVNAEDLSPSMVYSPTFDQPVFSRPSGKLKTRNLSRKHLLSAGSEEDKENVTPKKSSGSVEIDFFKSDSQDSGYLSTSQPMCNLSQSPHLFSPVAKRKSSIFVDEDDDSMSMFNFEETEDIHDFLSVPDHVSSLLTKPLIAATTAEPLVPPRGKPSICRCLSMEMNFDVDSPITSRRKLPSQSPTILEENPAKSAFKRPDPPAEYFTVHSKRRKSSPSIEPLSASSGFVFQRSYSETATTIMHAIMKSDLQPDLIGDGSRSYALPMVKGRHQDLKCITPDTLVRLLQGEFSEEIEGYTLIDCRYPYEFDGGHIVGAQNIYTKEDILQSFLGESSNPGRHALIFHCEFSSERAPSLCRFLRSKDREINEGNYPSLNHPEVYILEGGYKAFFEEHQELCEPQGYKPMNHKDHGFEYRHFRAKSKSWGADYKGRSKLRSNSSASDV